MSASTRKGTMPRHTRGKLFSLVFIVVLQSLVVWGSAVAATDIKQSLVDVSYYSRALILARGTIYANFATEAKQAYKLVQGLNVIRLPVPPQTTSVNFSYQTSNAKGVFKAVYKKASDTFDAATDGKGLGSFTYNANGFNGTVTIPSSEVGSADGQIWIIADVTYVQATSVMNHSFMIGDRTAANSQFDAWSASILDGGSAASPPPPTNTGGGGSTPDPVTDPDPTPAPSPTPTPTTSEIQALQDTLDALVTKINALCSVTDGVDNLCVVQP